MSDWNAAIAAAQAALPKQAGVLDALKRPEAGTECLHLELTFDSGDYMLICHTCGSRWVMTALGRESGIDRQSGQIVGGDPSLANRGSAANLSGHRRVSLTGV